MHRLDVGQTARQHDAVGNIEERTDVRKPRSHWHQQRLALRDLGNGGAEISSEFTITETIGTSAMLYASLYALETK